MHNSYIEKLALVLSQEAAGHICTHPQLNCSMLFAHSLAGCAITESSQLTFAPGGMST
jgi:hypothetical protein